MAKRQVIGLSEAWWVWIGEKPAIRVESEAIATSMLLTHGSEFGFVNSYGRPDSASAVAEMLWSDPLPEGASFHKTVFSPVSMVLHNGAVRKVLAKPLTPSKLASLSKAWFALEPRVEAWMPRQYQAAFDDPDVLVVRGKKPLKAQLDARWPALESVTC